jgi:hypothetical protein
VRRGVRSLREQRRGTVTFLGIGTPKPTRAGSTNAPGSTQAYGTSMVTPRMVIDRTITGAAREPAC